MPKPMIRTSMTFHLIGTTFLICFGSSFLIGYNLAIFNNPEKWVKIFLLETLLDDDVDEEDASIQFLYALTNTVFVIATAIGAFGSCFVADFFGRRNGTLVNHFFALIGALLTSLVVKCHQPALLYIGRFFSGLNCGITTGIASLYLTEIAPRSQRGIIGACHQLAITLGIATSYLVTMDWTMNQPMLWPAAYALSVIPCMTSLALLPFFPESPRYLFLKKKDEAKARLAFSKLNKTENIETFIGEMREEMQAASNQTTFKFYKLFTQRDLRMPVLLACLIQVMQQFSGINAVITYSSTMFKTAGLPDEYIQMCVLIIGVVNVIVTIISLPLLEKLGRRPLLLWPTLCLAVTLLVLSVIVPVSDTIDDLFIKKSFGGLAAFFIFVYIVSFGLGLGPIPGLLVSEIFRQDPRAAAYSLSQGVQALSNLVVVSAYPSINKAIGGFSFLPFLIIVVCCWIFIYLFMPETKNRTFEEMATNLALGKMVVGKEGGGGKGGKKNQALECPLPAKSANVGV